MVRVTVLYLNESAKRFHHDYYARKHMPMVMERLKGSGMLRYEVDKGLAGGGPGAPAPFVAACHLYFNAAADFQKGIAAHGTRSWATFPTTQMLARTDEVIEDKAAHVHHVSKPATRARNHKTTELATPKLVAH